mgnify:CR=1 FL=1
MPAATALGTRLRDQPFRVSSVESRLVDPRAARSIEGTKLAVGRQRPAVEDLPHLMATPTGLSFPSSHSTSSFAAAQAYGPLLPRGPLLGAAASPLRARQIQPAA